MKKFLCVLISTIIVFSLFSCSDKKNDDVLVSPWDNAVVDNSQYRFLHIDWEVYKSVDELIDAADSVFIGKVTGVDFEALDFSGKTVAEEEERYLHTCYFVDVITSYKGETDDVVTIKNIGGMVNYEVDKQLTVMNEEKVNNWESEKILVQSDYYKHQCFVGSYYLFVLMRSSSGHYTILNSDQSVWDLKMPNKESEFGAITARNIISEFGYKKLKDFDKQWKNGDFS